MTTTVLDPDVLEAKQQSAKLLKKAKDEYFAVVRDRANGRRVTPDRINEVIRAAGKTHDDLSAAVEHHKNRIKWADVIRHAETVAGEKEGISRKISAASAKLEAAQREYQQAIAPLVQRQGEIATAEATAVTAQQNLVDPDTYPYEDLIATRNELAQRVWQIGNDIAFKKSRSTKEVREEAQKLLAKGQKIKDGEFSHYKPEDFEFKGKQTLADCDAFDAEIAEHQKELDTLEPELAKLDEQLLRP
jgi:chromosome segregation ATPase